MQKKNILKIIILLVLIIVVFLILLATRKVLIVTKLQENISKYENSENYHYTEYSYNLNQYVIKDIYCLGDKKAICITNVVDGKKSVNRVYINGNKMNIYTERDNQKLATINKDGKFYEKIPDNLYTENLLQTILGSITATVKKEKCNGIDCYYIKNFASPLVMSEGDIYIDKNTGLPLRLKSYDVTNSKTGKTFAVINDYVFEFDTVTDNDFQEPNIAEYIVQ